MKAIGLTVVALVYTFARRGRGGRSVCVPAARGEKVDARGRRLEERKPWRHSLSDPNVARGPGLESDERTVFAGPAGARLSTREGGFSLTAGRDFPDAPFTGGLKLRF